MAPVHRAATHMLMQCLKLVLVQDDDKDDNKDDGKDDKNDDKDDGNCQATHSSLKCKPKPNLE